MKTLLFIYNPHAGRQRVSRQLADILYLFASAGYLVTAHPTLFREDAVRIAAEAGAQFDHVVCCGGDGTLNEVVRGLLLQAKGKIPTLGYLPAGTTNDFSKTLGLPASPLRAAEIAVGGAPTAVDVGAFNDRPFIYVAGFGLFTEVSYATSAKAKHHFGRLAYVLAGVASLAQLHAVHMRVTHDGETIEDDFIYGQVSDSISVGGFRGISEDAVVLDDGLFEVMLVRRPSSMEELGTILHALRTRTPDGNVIGFQSADILFEAEAPLAWTLDGEYGGDVRTAHIVNRPRQLQIMRGTAK